MSGKNISVFRQKQHMGQLWQNKQFKPFDCHLFISGIEVESTVLFLLGHPLYAAITPHSK